MVLAIAVLCAAASTAAAAPLAKARTERNVDWVSAGVGGLGAGTGVITLAGVSGEVKLALLYWHGIDRPVEGGDGVYDNPQVSFAGVPVAGTGIGDGPTNCWPPGGAGAGRAYRADVTSLVTGNGNYAVGGLAAGAGHDGNGASLVVLFDDGNPANDRDLVFFEGNDANIPDGFAGETDGWNALLDVTYPGGSVAVELHAADGQSLNDGTVAFSTFVSLPIADSATRWDGLSVPDAGQGRAGDTGALWDIHRFDLSSLFAAPGATAVTVSGLIETDDCLSLVLALVDLQATPPTATPTFTPTSVPTATATATPSITAATVGTATGTATPLDLETPTAAVTDTPTGAPTLTPTLSAPLPSPTGTATVTPTLTVIPATLTPTPGAPTVPSLTATATATAVADVTHTAVATGTFPATPTSTAGLASPTSTATAPNVDQTPTATVASSATVAVTSTPGDEATPTPTGTAAPTATPTANSSATATATASGETPTVGPSPTATGSATATSVPECLQPCAGDCNGNCRVTIDELILMVNMALLESPTTPCPAGDGNADGTIAIDELVRATNRSLFGCPPAM